MPSKQSPAAKTQSASVSYNILLTGEVLDGHKPEQAKKWLAETLKISNADAAALLAGKSRCIKRNLKAGDAAKYRDLFERKGVAVRITKNGDAVSSQMPPGAASSHQTQTQQSKTPHPKQTAAPGETAPTQVISTGYFNGSINAVAPWYFENVAAIIALVATLILSLIYAAILLGCVAFAARSLVYAAFPAQPLTVVSMIAFQFIPAAILLFLFALLLRPVFAQQNSQRMSLEIEAAKQAKLVQFVREIFQQLGARVPEKISVSYEPKVTAELDCNLLKPSSAVASLTLGMPLLMTLRTPQLAAFIAHEAAQLQHPMRACLFKACARVRHRFDDCAENQDLWSRRLDAIDMDDIGRIKGLAVSSLATLHYYSAFMFKPFSMAFNYAGIWSNKFLVNAADFYVTELVGSNAFVEAFKQMAVTSHALHQAEQRMFNRIGERQLINNIPALVHHFAVNLTVRDKREIEDEMNSTESRRDYDYPSDRSRIIFCEDLDRDGISCADFPAAELLTNIGVLNEQVTLLYYRHLQLEFDVQDLMDVHQLANLADKDQKREQLSAQYFNNWFDPELFWKIPAPESVKNLTNIERVKMLNDAVSQIRHITPDYVQLVAGEPKMFAALVNTSVANEIRKAGYKVGAGEFGLNDEQAKHLSEFHTQNRNDYTNTSIRLTKMREVMGTRLFLAISLHPDAAKRKVGVMLLQALACLYQHHEKMNSLKVKVAYLPILAAREKDKKETEHAKRIQRVASDVKQFAKDALASLQHFKCTFSQSHDHIGAFVKAHTKQEPNGETLHPLETVDYFYEINYGLAEANRMLNNQLAMIALESELLNKITPVKLASG